MTLTIACVTVSYHIHFIQSQVGQTNKWSDFCKLSPKVTKKVVYGCQRPIIMIVSVGAGWFSSFNKAMTINSDLHIAGRLSPVSVTISVRRCR